MKQLLTTIAALVLVGCGESQSPEPPTAKAPDRSIHNAAYDGNIEAVKQHLAAGADVNAKDEFKKTCLHHAAMNGHKEIAELLITNGADLNAKDVYDSTPLDWAIISKIWAVESARSEFVDDLSETADLLRKHGGKTGEELMNLEGVKESIHAAARVGHIEAVKEHLEVVRM
jgi:hypothetical protein